METQEITRLERMFRDSVRSYLHGCESGMNDELSEELRDPCSTMARLLECLLLMDEKWNEYWRVHDVLFRLRCQFCWITNCSCKVL
jgi:hypothetical protein